MSKTSVYKTRVRTDSADSNALLLLDNGELVAILVELSDEGHGEDQGKWIIESLFGIHVRRKPEFFSGAAQAANWIGEQVCNRVFDVGPPVPELN